MSNVAGSWLNSRHIDKMSMYSRPGNIYCILKESSVQSMSTWCLEGSTPHMKFGSAHKWKNYGKAPHIKGGDILNFEKGGWIDSCLSQ